jgi:hypothetical protein
MRVFFFIIILFPSIISCGVRKINCKEQRGSKGILVVDADLYIYFYPCDWRKKRLCDEIFIGEYSLINLQVGYRIDRLDVTAWETKLKPNFKFIFDENCGDSLYSGPFCNWYYALVNLDYEYVADKDTQERDFIETEAPMSLSIKCNGINIPFYYNRREIIVKNENIKYKKIN